VGQDIAKLGQKNVQSRVKVLAMVQRLKLKRQTCFLKIN
jgi:hypothetical protein